ncbi:MAG: hypothetical protein FWF78_01035 [Defluviitaleaceae bacterium]|nr:hypothetical protein [Defluviitaleaceae bacterium]
METKKFNWSVFLGFCVAAVILSFAIANAAATISSHLSNAAHTIAMQNNHLMHQPATQDNEFMNEWEAARFLTFSFDEFNALLQSGVLYSTYAEFEVERRVFARHDGTMWLPQVMSAEPAVQVAAPVPIEYETITGVHRVFSRERLTEWLNNRI